jgi:hypothetical protein
MSAARRSHYYAASGSVQRGPRCVVDVVVLLFILCMFM